MDEPRIRPPSFPLAPGPDTGSKRPCANASPSTRSTQRDSIGCPVCWPLGASELGYCICEDLELAKVPVSTHSSSFSQIGKNHRAQSSQPYFRDTARFCKSPDKACQNQVAKDTDTPSLPKNQETSTCARCWPLGASELGYCICSDLVLAGILRPASGSD